MEIVFLVLSLIVSLSMIYVIGRTFYSHKKLLLEYKMNDLLVLSHTMIGIVLCAVIFVTLCAINNTYWIMPYITT